MHTSNTWNDGSGGTYGARWQDYCSEKDWLNGMHKHWEPLGLVVVEDRKASLQIKVLKRRNG